MYSKTIIITMLLLAGYVHADEQVRGVQEELRRRNLYFGDIDGQKTPELEKATMRYQKRKGFSANGIEDRDTLRSLGLLPRSPDEAAPKKLEWPSEPVLKSDTKIDVVAEAQQISAETGVAPESIAPAEILKASKLTSKTSGQKRPITKSSFSEPSAPRPASNSRETARDQLLEPAELSKFVIAYMDAVSHNDICKELEFYGDRVKYYANGEVDRRIIERIVKRYYLRWPSRKYTIARTMTVGTISSRGEIVMTFLVDFTLKNKGQVVKGQTENRITINAGTSDPRIVAIEEYRVRR